MKKRFVVFGLLILLVTCTTMYSAEKLDRPALVSLMEKYLDALAKHDPSLVPLASDIKLVENTEVTSIGKGLWETATGGPTDFKIFAADPVTGQIGFIGVIEVKGKPTILGARIKVVDGKITEADHLVIPPYGDSLNPNMSNVRPGLITPIKPEEKVSREEMLRIANSYYEAIVNDNGNLCPFADESQRRENGGISANDQTVRTPEEEAKDDWTVFRKMKCGEQLSTGVMSYITDINRRRLLAVDEEMGLVFALSIFVHDGEPKVMKIIGVPGITERENKYGPFDLPAAHIFKIRNGKVYEIEAIGYLAKHGIKNGWEE